MRFLSIAFIVCAVSFIGCNNVKPSSDASATTAPVVAKVPVKSKLSDEGTKKLMDVVASYYELKNAMISAKADTAAKAATQLAAAAGDLQAYLQKDTANMASIKPYTDTIVTQSKLTASISDPSCEKQRLEFGPISSAIYNMLKNVELKNAKIYHEYCPMAYNEKGGYWLSEESEIQNPYFGKKMMECGEVADSLQ